MSVEDGFSIEGVDMDAINSAIESALSGETLSDTKIGKAIDEADASAKSDSLSNMVPSSVKKKKAEKLSASDVGIPVEPSKVETKKLVKESPAKTRSKTPTLSNYGTPILRAAKDKCSVCGTKVTWYSTTTDTGAPIWQCSECGREVARGKK